MWKQVIASWSTFVCDKFKLARYLQIADLRHPKTVWQNIVLFDIWQLRSNYISTTFSKFESLFDQSGGRSKIKTIVSSQARKVSGLKLNESPNSSRSPSFV